MEKEDKEEADVSLNSNNPTLKGGEYDEQKLRSPKTNGCHIASLRESCFFLKSLHVCDLDNTWMCIFSRIKQRAHNQKVAFKMF